MAPAFPLPGRVALVTGAGGGIGLETARLLHRRGAAVALVDVEREAAEAAAAALGERALALAADVSDPEAIAAATDAAAARLGGLDVVVANAGIAPPPRPFRALDAQTFDRVIEVDLLGVARTVRAALPHLVARRGHVVVVASIYAFMNAVMATPYAMSKAGVEALGRGLRAELAPHGASAGVAYFGFIDTGMVREVFADPLAQRVQSAFPSVISRRLTAAQAAASLVRGIERRAPRSAAPRWIAAWSALRGLVNPAFDRITERDERIAAAVLEGEREAGPN